MNTPSPQKETSLLFNWQSETERNFAIIGFLAASAILHVFCFYIFQIVYPPAVVLLPPPARVNLIAPNSEEGRTLLPWIDAEDPALAFATVRPPEARRRAFPRLQHIPSYQAMEPRLKTLPPLSVNPPTLSSQPPGPVPIRPDQIARKTVSAPTRVSFSEELAGLGEATLPPFTFRISTTESPEGMRFRIGVGPRGEIRYCLPLNSSGDSALDKQAREYLVLGRFPPRGAAGEGGDQTTVWGIATIDWGNDLGRLQTPSTTNPPP